MPADFLTRNMFFREASEDTPNQALSGGGFSGNPQQMLQMLQSPEMQQQLGNFGIHFDPSLMQQSPFVGNQFMQQHPRLGGAFTGALANLAATPEAPMVSGFGSGLSRMAQGMGGGPEMLRQYQMRQLMAPFQAAGMQMPMMGEMRRQQLLQALMQDMQDRSGQAQESERNKLDIAQRKLDMTRPQMGPYGMISPMPEGQTQYPSGMPSELGGQVSGPQMPQGSQQLGNFMFTPYKQGDVASVAQGKETPATANLKQSQATLAGAKGATEKSKQDKLGAETGEIKNFGIGSKGRDRGGVGGQGGKAAYKPTDISKQYNAVEKQYTDTLTKLDAALKAKQLDENSYNQLKTQALVTLQTSKQNIDQAQGNPGASARGERQSQSKQSQTGAANSSGSTQTPTSGVHYDEAGNMWDYTDPQHPKYVGKYNQNAPTGQQ